jgi:hypothetical protein
MVVDEHAVADLKPFHLRPDRDDHSDRLVAENQRRFFLDVPGEHIA